MRKYETVKLAVVSVLLCLTLLVSATAHASRTKVSYKGEDFGNCPDNQGAVIKIAVTDATRAQIGDTTRRITGDSGFSEGDSVAASAMYLVCNGVSVTLQHTSIAFVSEDDGMGNITVKFDPVEITAYDQTAINNIVPTIDTQAVWCSLIIPESSSNCDWEFPNAMLLDRVAPNVDGSRFYTEVPMGMEDGQVYHEWYFNDPGTPGDPDGDNGTGCGDCPAGPAPTTAGGKWCCNKTDTRFQWQLFRRASTGLYSTTSIGSTDGALTYMMDTGPTTTKDRFIDNPDTFCYEMRIQDSAGNWSIESNLLNTAGTSTKEEEKCIRPDGKAPTVENVEFFTDYDAVTGFSGQFPLDFLGKPIVTSNPCQFDALCDITVDRYIEIKITTSEPLFDGQNRFGYTYISGDNFDNDNDGSTDEEAGGFDNVDNDGDGLVDEDVENTTSTYPLVVNDMRDNDADGYVDEEADDYDGIDNDGDGSIDEDISSRHCSSKEILNRAHTSALTESEDVCFSVPLITIEGVDSEGRAVDQRVEWVCTQDGVTTNPECTGLTTGQTVYRYRWRVGRASGDVPPIGLEEGYYDITFSAIDGVGNIATDITPDEGSPVWVDNSPPEIELNYFTDYTFASKFNVDDHDNDSGTEDMPVVPETDMYFSVTLKTGSDPEHAGATPEVYFFLPDSRTPPYEGEPQPGVYESPTVYSYCGQNSNCNWKTGANCIEYDPEVEPCETFRGALTIDSSTMNDGYAAVTVSVKDRYSNRSWHETDAQAAADQLDADKLSDDVGLDGNPGTADSYEGDGVPNYISLSPEVETDITISKGQFFAIDTTPPDAPAMSRPIAPCNGAVARDNGSCSTSAVTTNTPQIKWATLGNNLNDDQDSATDEECVDGIDDDGDDDGSGRWIDEDGTVCANNGTWGWEIARWRLQVSTTPTFATGTLIRNTIVSGVNYTMPALQERPITSPYYWRLAPFDVAGNMGEYNPTYPMVASDTPYFTFAVDTTPPQFTVQYFTDANCSVPMPTASDGTPVTGDTVTGTPEAMVCMTVTSDESIPYATQPTTMPALALYQQGFPVQSTTTVPMPSGSVNSFRAIVEIDAQGSSLQYMDGAVQVRVSSEDVYGNELDNVAAASGSTFYVDSTAPECTFESPSPDPASMDNNTNGTEGELDPVPDGDAVTITFYCNKYIGSSVNFRVVQNNFNTTPLDDDLLDNDCDGLIDEDPAGTGTDSGSSGQQPGSGCWVEADYATGTSYTYTGYYNVVPDNYDGTVDVILGDSDSTSMYYLTDMIGNSVRAETTFEVDTNGPAAPVLTNPIHDQVVKKTLPQFKWTISPRSSDLKKYIIEVATSTNFTNIAVYAEVNDDGYSTSFFYTLVQNDIAECQTYSPISNCPGLSDNTYYWRMYSVDEANNRTKSSLKPMFHIDTQPPGPPVFNDVTTPTTLSVSPLSGYTDPPEKNATVNIYVTNSVGVQKYVGAVTTDSSGNFTVGTDDDSDNFVDEDPVNGTDDDFDGSTDEDPAGIFLNEGKNVITGLVVDAGGNVGEQGCSSATPFYDSDEEACLIFRDSGAPTFDILYYSDAALTTPLQVIDESTYMQVASATTVYMYIVASEELANPPTFTVDQQGTSDISTTSASLLSASSTVEFIGQFTVNAESKPNYVDGEALIVVIGSDLQGNSTPAGTVPNSGGSLMIDTKPPTFRITYWSDSKLQEPLPKDSFHDLLPVTTARDLYMRITPNEKLISNPFVNISQPGTVDQTGGTTTAVDTSNLVFKHMYTVNYTNGTEYVDGTASVTVQGTDLAGNTVTATPTQGDQFYIDTTPPQAPTINLPSSTADFTQITVSGSVSDIYNNAEVFAEVEIYVKLKLEHTADDLLNNDGDGRADEEPNGFDGIDNDNDLFIDEDVTENVCATGYIWDASSTVCITALSYTPDPDGTAITNTSGGYTASVSGIQFGVNYLYARATDVAGNTSAFSEGTPIVGSPVQVIKLSHTFPKGWNIVGVPLQPSISVPSAGLGVPDLKVYQLKNGEYVYAVGLDAIAPGMAYWIYFPTERTVSSSGIVSSTNKLKLSEGWNLVSLPYELPVQWNSDMKVSTYSGSGIYNIGSSEGNELVEPYIYTYNGSVEPYGYNPAIGISDGYSMQPWIGFAIKALDDCWLVFPSRFDISE